MDGLDDENGLSLGPGNYYGSLHLRKRGEVYEWGVQNHDDDYGWEPVPEYVGQALERMLRERAEAGT
jgi:hypothetical protein